MIELTRQFATPTYWVRMPLSNQSVLSPPSFWSIARKQLVAISFCLALLGIILAILYVNDRTREWRLREEQATHRLELAYELISRDLQRVRSDVLYVANQDSVKSFDPASPESLATVQHEFVNLIEFKQTYQQIRLLEANGMEAIRVELVDGNSRIIAPQLLQDKRDRYYFREALTLQTGEIFVSDFDLNQERGKIEQPLNPVIRFVTPVVSDQGNIRFLLVANYRGGPLLNELATISLPGKTLLMRDDGQYLLAENWSDTWGWLLDHAHSFSKQFPTTWNQKTDQQSLRLIPREGAFAFRKIQLSDRERRETASAPTPGFNLFLASYLPGEEVFATSDQLLNRLLILGATMLLPLFLLTRLWAVASARRAHQSQLVRRSEQQLRELSGRLVKIQEDERRSISREIHDQLGQQVTAINLDLKLANKATNLGDALQQLERAIDESENLLESLHDFAARVRPVELDDLGLHDAVESHLHAFNVRTKIEYGFVSNIEEANVSTVVSENVFRLIQESLNNVVRHANATRVEITIQSNPTESPHELKVTIQDNGIGLPRGEHSSTLDNRSIEGSSRLGILGMRERVGLLGGTLEFVSLPDEGTMINATIPIHDPTETGPEI